MEEKDESSDDVAIDFGKVKHMFKHKGDSSDSKESRSFFKNPQVYIVLALVLIPMFFSIYFREFPIYLPVTDQWAQQSLQQMLKQEMSSQISQEFPNLPTDRKNALVNDRVTQFLKDNQKQVTEQLKAQSTYFKGQLQNEWGHTYILDIDPYYQYREARYLIEKGHPGDIVRDGQFIDTQKFPPKGIPISPDLLMYCTAVLYWILALFNFWPHYQTVFIAAFHIPVVISAIAVIPAFFIARRVSGNLGGVIAATIVGIVPQYIARTSAGVPDTDGFNVLFPLLITWIYLESLDAKSWKWTFILGGLAGFFIGVFSFSWEGWWYIFVILITATVGYLLYFVFTQIVFHKLSLPKIMKSKQITETLALTAIFIVASGVFVVWFDGANALRAPLNALNPMKAIGKNVAENDIFPKIHTTVAELNDANINQVVNEMEGKTYYIIALLGILLIVIKEEKNLLKAASLLVGSLVWYIALHSSTVLSSIGGQISIYVILLILPAIVAMLMVRSERVTPYKHMLILLIWFAVSVYATLNGIRFLMLLVPTFAVGFGIAIGILYQYIRAYVREEIKNNIARIIVQTLAIILSLTLLIVPMTQAYSVAMNQVPLINKSWVTALQKITADSKPDAIINSWWDYGHWFITVANRSATFDGSVQRGSHAYWIGRSFLTNDEDTTVGILRMLNCGANDAYDLLNAKIKNGPKSIKILNEIIVLDKEGARTRLSSEGLDADSVNQILEKTHCNSPEDYYIASDDMIGKSGVWAHFGSWNFTRADMYLNVKKMSETEGISYLQKNYGLTANEAVRYYNQIQTQQADNWIAPWPSYAGELQCQETEPKKLSCDQNIEVDMDKMEAGIRGPDGKLYSPKKLVVPKADGTLAVKEFTENLMQSQRNQLIGITVVPHGNSWGLVLADPVLSDSMFTRLFWLQGFGLKHFRLLTYEQSFNGNEIYVWKVDWAGSMLNNLAIFKKYETPQTTTNQETTKQQVSLLNESINGSNKNAANDIQVN
jgi:dolichyl-phosphooligosaccharide-protein glycotransferase